MHTLEIQDVTISRGNRVLIHDSSLSLQTGDILAISGKNGCGKATLLKALFGTHKADDILGSLDQKPLARPSPKLRHIAG